MNILGNSEEIDKVQKRNLWALFFIGLIYGFASRPFFLVYQIFLLEWKTIRDYKDFNYRG